MRITYGSTRIVVLIGSKAIKIGKIKFLKALARVLVFLTPFFTEKKKDWIKKYENSFQKAFLATFISGPRANLWEFQYYQSTHDQRVVPTTSLHLWGLIIVQDRGTHVTASELEAEHPIPTHNKKEFDMELPKQFCRILGKVLLADYGDQRTLTALRLGAA